MNATPLLHRLTLALALCLSAAPLLALAADAVETTDIEVVQNGKSEKVSIADLKVGETRQLYSEAGTLVTATRTAESLELDIAGDKTSIKMIEAGELDDPELAALIEAHAGGDGTHHKRVIRVHREGDAAEHAAHAEAHHKVIVLKGGDGKLHDGDADGEDVKVIVKQLDGEGSDEGKRVIVKRRVNKPADGETK